MKPYRGLTKEGKWAKGWYWYNDATDKHYIRQTNFQPAEYDYTDYKVIPETVGQSTGLKDKKRTKEYPEGQEIYEGDIVIIGCYHLRAVIEYEHCGFVMHHIKGSKRREYCANSRSEPIFYNCNISVEVIGNIHEKPELIEEKDNG